MFYVPADCAIGCGACAETVVIAKPTARGEANASATDDGLVGEQRRSALREGGNEDLRVQISGFHPGWQVGDGAFRGRLLLGNDNVAGFGGGIVRKAESKRKGTARAVTCRVQRFREERVKLNVLTSQDRLLLSGSGGCWAA